MRHFRSNTWSWCLLAPVFMVIALAPSYGSESGDWPFIRGENFDGHSDDTRLVDAFPPAGPPVLWTRPLGIGYSGLTAADERVYTQYQTLGGQFVICLNAGTGETIWEYRYEGPYDPAGLYPGPRGTPTLGGGRVYFSAPSGLIGCLNALDGRLFWSFNLFERFHVDPVEFGYSISPTLVDGLLLLPVGKPRASMVALDAKTGKTVWQSGDDPISHVPALPIERQGRQFVVGYLRNALVAFDLQHGDILWRKSLSGGYDEHAAWPLYSDSHVWISGPFQSGSELIELIDEPPGYRTVWKSRLMSNDVCSSVLVDGYVYGFDLKEAQAKPHRPSRGQFRCISFLTGEQQWSDSPINRSQLNDGRSLDASQPANIGQASVLVADGKLILFNDRGELILARASPEQFSQLGRASVLGGEICWTQPMLYRGRLYVRNHSRAACIVLSRPEANSSSAATRLTVADIPQTTYRDWAATLLAVEPEYAMDLPTFKELRLWFAVALGGLAGATILGRLSAAILNNIWPGPAWTGWLTGALAMLFGAAGTTLLSRWADSFIFTWPLCLFVGFLAPMAQLARPSGAGILDWLRPRAILAAFVALCVLYFLICRRLSLAFEWVFLTGFLAAVPALLWARRDSRNNRWAAVREWAYVSGGFAAYYWASVLVLWWRYRH